MAVVRGLEKPLYRLLPFNLKFGKANIVIVESSWLKDPRHTALEGALKREVMSRSIGKDCPRVSVATIDGDAR